MKNLNQKPVAGSKKIGLILAVVYILFISMFAFDEIGHSFIGFLIHLIPSFILVLITFISYKNSRVGGILFLVLAIVFTIFFNTYRELISFALISLPVAVIGILLLCKKKI